ncbi:hypothetical protein Tco_0579178 [Tanacetum coccineum]
MCHKSWGRINYARALIELSAGSDLKTKVTMAVTLEDREGFTREVISMEYEWKQSHCTDCKAVGHCLSTCPMRSSEKPTTAPMDISNDGFTKVVRKKNKGKRDDCLRKIRVVVSSLSLSRAPIGQYRSMNLPMFDVLNTLNEDEDNRVP